MTDTNSILTDLGWSAHFMSQLGGDELDRLTPARLTQIHRTRIEVITDRGPLTVTTRSDDSTGDFAVGDWVLLNPATQIERRLDRMTLLERRVAGGDARSQLIGANIDILFITTSCNKDFNVARLERYLILARSANIQPVLLMTKADLADDPQIFAAEVAHLDPTLPVIPLDARDPAQAAGVYNWWHPGQTAALLGSSGVGKTTLLNTLTGGNYDIGDIRKDDSKGRHTTTARGLYRVGDNRWLLDTPGMRELRLLDVAEGVDAVFADILELTLACRFSDCSHDSEPGCAVQDAITSGDLDPDRLKRWQTLEREDHYNSETVAQARKRTKGRAKMIKSTVSQRRPLKER